MHLGYVVNSYPLPSHSFIRCEIAALESLGHDVHRFAMRGDRSALADPLDRAEHDRTEHLHDRGARGLLDALLRESGAAPAAVAGALRLARTRAAAGESSLARQFAYLAEGAVIARRARALGLDHLHAHFGTNSTRIAGYARRLGGPPFSFTVHGPEEFDAPLQLDLGGKIASAAFAVAVSSFGRSQLWRWAAPQDWNRVHVVHCGIDLDEFPAPLPLPADPGRLVAVGRFAEQKGFGLLVRAFARARAERPRLRLTLVGDGPLRPQIEAMLVAAGLGETVELAGWQDRAGVRRALAAADALVVPSFAEGLPVVMMEAMALGRPVVATMIAGIPELARPGHDGWLVPAGDEAALAAAMVAVADSPREAIAAMGQSGRARVVARHDARQSAAQLAALFRQAGEATRRDGQPAR